MGPSPRCAATESAASPNTCLTMASPILESITVHTGAGILMLELHVEGNRVESVRVNMGLSYLQRDQIPIAGAGASPVMGELISIDGREFAITAVSMGNPHAVIFTNDVQQIPLEQIGPKIERNLPARTNVHFVEVHSDNEITMRTWERGAGITPACGTGACASVVASALNNFTGRTVKAHLPGGDLVIEWAEDNHGGDRPGSGSLEGEIDVNLRILPPSDRDEICYL